MLHNWLAKYREFSNEPLNSAEKVRELEQRLAEQEKELRARAQRMADVEEELAIVKKSSAHLQQTKELRFQFIETHRSEFRVEKMCSMLKVSRSGFYKWREKKTSPQAERKAKLIQRITYHFKDNQRRYGSPKITKLLQKEGYTVSERTVGKYMQELGLRSCVAKRFHVKTTDSHHDLPIAPNLHEVQNEGAGEARDLPVH